MVLAITPKLPCIQLFPSLPKHSLHFSISLIPHMLSTVQLFISVIIGASFNYACSPLFFELAVELAFPVSEGVVGAFLTISWNIVAALFLFIMQTPLAKSKCCSLLE